MQIKKYSVNAPRDWLVWWLPSVGAVAMVAALTVTDQDGVAVTIACATAGAFLYIFAARTYHRLAFKRSIRGYTPQGVGVIGEFPFGGEFGEVTIDWNVRWVAGFWSEKLGIPIGGCLGAFNGTFAVAAETITNTWSGPRREVGGASVDGFANVKVGPGDSPDLVQSRLRHEFSHVLLDRLGYADFEGGALHHRMFEEHGFTDV